MQRLVLFKDQLYIQNVTLIYATTPHQDDFNSLLSSLHAQSINIAPFLKTQITSSLFSLIVKAKVLKKSSYLSDLITFYFLISFLSILQIMQDKFIVRTLECCFLCLNVLSPASTWLILNYHKSLLKYYLLNKAFPNHFKIIHPSDIPKGSLFPAFFPVILNTH